MKNLEMYSSAKSVVPPKRKAIYSKNTTTTILMNHHLMHEAKKKQEKNERNSIKSYLIIFANKISNQVDERAEWNDLNRLASAQLITRSQHFLFHSVGFRLFQKRTDSS